MRKLRKIVMLLLSVALTYSFLSITQAISQEKKVLRMGQRVSDILSMDPHLGTTTSDLAAADALFNSLLRFPRGTISFDIKDIEGDLAEKWESSRDGLVWTFHLRRGVKFHKGYGELTAEDVKFSLEKSANPKTSAFAGIYEALDKVEALDRYTVRITLKHPVPSIMTMLSNFRSGFILSKKAVLEKGGNFKFDPIGTGPFMLGSYEPKVKGVFVRNPDYYEGRPLLDEYEMWFMPDAAPREMAYRTGMLDMIEGIKEKAWVEKMKKMPQTVVAIFGPGEYLILFMNVTKKPFSDIRVRKAFNHGISQEEVMDFIGRELTKKSVSPIPAGHLGYTDKVPIYPFDPGKAKALLKEAGYPDGFKLDMVMTESTSYRRPMEQIQEQLRRIGVDIKLNITGHSTFHEQIRKDVNLLNLYSGIATLRVADAEFTRFWYGPSIVGKPTAMVNLSHYDKVDREIEMARKDPDPEKRLVYWAEAQRKIMEDAAAKPICNVLQTFAIKSNVKLGYELIDSQTVCPQITWKTDIVK